MKTLLDAAHNGETVTATIMKVEPYISKKGNATLKIGMICKDTGGFKLEGWITQYFSPAGEWFNQMFLDALFKPSRVLFEADDWIYNENELKYNTAKCQLGLEEYNGKMYPKASKWIAAARDDKPANTTITSKANPEPTDDFDDDIPF